jgi:DNA mismatch endonuclease (patch repair protein)
MMSGIRGKHTKPEIVLRRLLWHAGIRYRLHLKNLPGRPDIAVSPRKSVIFVHGCFWHAHQGCRFAARPATRSEFWDAKLRGNVSRDKEAQAQLRALGWRVLVVWECATRDKQHVDKLAEQVLTWLGSDEPSQEVSENSLSKPPGRRSPRARRSVKSR